MSEADDVVRFQEAGLYDPVADAVTGRLELLRWLVGHGFTIDEMVEALHADALGSVAGDRRIVPGELLPAAEALRAVGLDPDDLDTDVRGFGFLPLHDAPGGELQLTLDEARMFVSFGQVGEMFTSDESGAFLRVVGSAMGRMADAAVSLFLADVESRSIASGEGELALAKKVYEAAGLLDGLLASLDPLYRRHVLQSVERSRRTMVSDTERLEYRYAIGFVDLVGFTEIAGMMDPHDLAAFLRDFEGQAYDVVAQHGARVVKLIGDEVMFAADDAASACRAGAALMDGFGAEYDHIVPRGGLAYGDVLVRGGDFYGAVVNLASRLVDEAVPLEMLVTAELADAAPGCEFEPAGRRMVKGFADPVTVRSLVH